ncbi:hypothetical protein [Streptosporangium sp. NPDC051022]|uniref:hypothetical protein n=1 Tax=Streptosporangium sp. NPDC051022 TaxID=3155752 RepID=UPI00342D2DB4
MSPPHRPLPRAGFDVRSGFLTGANSLTRKVFVEHDHDIAPNLRNIREDDPFQRLYDLPHTRSLTNTGGHSSPETDGLLDRLQVAANDNERLAAITKIEELWKMDAPSVGLGMTTSIAAWNKKVHGVVPSSAGLVLFGDAWIER